MKFNPIITKTLTIGVLTLALIGCSAPIAQIPQEIAPVPVKEVQTNNAQESTVYPLTIKHAFGETLIEKKPVRIATIAWGNQDVPLALGIVPIGISKANYGVTDDSGLLPWTAEQYKKLGVADPVLYDDLTALNYEAISDSNPDVILAAYSGISQEEYDLLSEIAPVVAYPELPWQTLWRDQILINSKGIGMEAEGLVIVSRLESIIAEKSATYTNIKGKSAAFLYFSPADLGNFYVYLPSDPRVAYLVDLGLSTPDSILELAKTESSFALSLSAENADILTDVDIIITYGDQTLLEALQKDPLISQIPAIQKGSVALIADNTPLAASGTPSALSIPAKLEEYLELINAAASNIQ